MNGVINIITEKAADTRGALVTAGGGNLYQGFGTVQYGGALGKSTDYRVYAKYQNDNHADLSGGYLQTTWNHAYSERSDTTLQIS